jgi:hypothetical protein
LAVIAILSSAGEYLRNRNLRNRRFQWTDG